MQTMKVKPWSADQGDHVVINADDFDAAVHVPFDEPATEVAQQDKAPARRTRRASADATAQE